MEYEVEGPRPRGRPKRTWREVVEKDCQARKLNKEDAIHCSRCSSCRGKEAAQTGVVVVNCH